MLRQKANNSVPLHLPEDDLQEISMLEESNRQFEYKTSAKNPKKNGFILDGWFTPNFETQSLLKTYRSHVVTPNISRSQCRKPQIGKSSAECLEENRCYSCSKKKQFANFRLKKTQTHEFQLNYSLVKKQAAKMQNLSKSMRLNVSGCQLASSHKNQLSFITRRPIVQVFNYPLLKKFKQNSPERKLTQNIGRVRRMLKLKFQHKK